MVICNVICMLHVMGMHISVCYMWCLCVTCGACVSVISSTCVLHVMCMLYVVCVHVTCGGWVCIYVCVCVLHIVLCYTWGVC